MNIYVNQKFLTRNQLVQIGDAGVGIPNHIDRESLDQPAIMVRNDSGLVITNPTTTDRQVGPILVGEDEKTAKAVTIGQLLDLLAN